MNKIEKTIRANNLLSVYQNLLTPTQQEIMNEYFIYDLSLSEIADNRHITRAAVEDAINKGYKKLEEYDEKLDLLNKKETVLSLLDKLKEHPDDKEIIKEIEKVVK